MNYGISILFRGSPGVGKTHIAVALGVEAVRARKEVRFTDCAALVRDLQDASSRGILQAADFDYPAVERALGGGPR